MTATDRPTPLRILHVLGGANHGGIESWLTAAVAHVDRQRFRMDFALSTLEPWIWEPQVRAIGSEVIYCLGPRRTRPWLHWTYRRRLREILQQRGPYDIVHSHVVTLTGYVLAAACDENVPVRIAHCHTSHHAPRHTRGRFGLAPLFRRQMEGTFRTISRCATHRLACSQAAAEWFCGPGREAGPPCELLYCGIDFSRFSQPGDPGRRRSELGIPADARVIAHVGRMVEPKNHPFLLEVFSRCAQRDNRVRLLLIGDGPLRGSLERRSADLGIADRVIFAGPRSDVPQLLLDAVDVLAFPSTWEGLGIAVVEGQAAGIPCVCSDRVPRDVDVVPGLVDHLPLEARPDAWADHLLARLAAPPFCRRTALETVQSSPFAIAGSVAALERLYLAALGAGLPAPPERPTEGLR